MVTKRDVFSVKYGASFSLFFEKDHNGKEYISEIVAHLPENQDFDITKIKDVELEFIDYAKNELITVTFPNTRTTDGAQYQYKIRSFKKENRISFRDLSTGAVLDVVLNTQGEWRNVFIPQNEENKTNPNDVYLKEKVDGENGSKKETYKLNKSFHARRVFEGPSNDGKFYVRIETGSPSETNDAMTIKSLSVEAITDKFRLADKSLVDVVGTGNETKEEISFRLKKLIQQTAELPGIGDRMNILNSLITRVKKKKAERILLGASKKEHKKHDLLGSVIQDFGHVALLGNPGTLKTVFAEILYWALRAEELITGPLTVVNGRSIIKGYVGQSEVEMRKHIQKAVSENGMLMIDEFHTLNDSEGSQKSAQFGVQAVREIIPAMENHRDQFVLVVAGYKDEMEKALTEIDPGLKDRFTQIHHFEDYNPTELGDIFYYLMPSEYTFTPEAREVMNKLIEAGYDKRGKTFGNGRAMRNLVNQVLQNQEQRLGEEGFYNFIIDNEGTLSDKSKERLREYRAQINEDDLMGVEVYTLAEKEKESRIGFTGKIDGKDKPKPKRESARLKNFNEVADVVSPGAVPANDNSGAETPFDVAATLKLTPK